MPIVINQTRKDLMLRFTERSLFFVTVHLTVSSSEGLRQELTRSVNYNIYEFL